MFDKAKSTQEPKKLRKVRAIYGKAKSPSESLNKFISPQEQTYLRKSPFSHNSPLHLNHSNSQFQNSKLSNSTSLNGLNMQNLENQRSRHHNSCNTLYIFCTNFIDKLNYLININILI